VDDVGGQATRTRTALTVTVCAEKRFLSVKIGGRFPIDYTGRTDEHSYLFLGPCYFFSADTPRNACTFFFEKSPLLFRCAFCFIGFWAKSFRPHGPSRLFFFSARATHLARRSGNARNNVRLR
jgi:hypothetical protein